MADDVQEIINDALVEIGILDPIESPTASQAQQALRHLNRMVDSWNAQRLTIYAIEEAGFVLTINQQSYTIGPASDTPDFTVTARPVRIDHANIVNLGVDPEERWPVNILYRDAWASRYTEYDFEYPSALYYEPTYPSGTIHLFDVPTAAHTLELWTWTAISAFASLTAAIDFPPGYEEALMYNLAVRLAPGYGRTAPQVTIAMALKSMAIIKSVNAPVPVQTTDYGLGAGMNSASSAPGGRITWR
jgi:hypothetical protein